jgi:hypothetical protein
MTAHPLTPTNWTEIEKLPIGTITDHPTDPKRHQMGIGLADYGIPPAGFTPAIGDWYYPPAVSPGSERAPRHWMGEEILPGSKFPVQPFKNHPPFEPLA